MFLLFLFINVINIADDSINIVKMASFASADISNKSGSSLKTGLLLFISRLYFCCP